MKLGEKLQQLRKQGGLSQEQLAGQLGVSRQAVSKWELDETMPDTENVLQLSRIFSVSCDYLLREEVIEPDAPLPAPPGETHLNEQGWTRNAFTLSLATCAIGLLLAVGWSMYDTSAGPAAFGLMIQISGVALFELAAPRMGAGGNTARLKFYAIACWLVLPIPVPFLLRGLLDLFHWSDRFRNVMLSCGLLYLLLCAAVTAALTVLRRRLACKK